MLNRMTPCFTVLVCVAVVGLSGCQSGPQWGPQGTIGEQRARAVLHDPFPSNELGPPIQGGRPVGFEQPRSESTTLQTSPYARQSARGGRVAPNYGF